MISLATAEIPLKAYKNIYDCLRTERIGRGKYVTLLEDRAKEYFGVQHCIALANGTLADIVMLATLKVMYPGKTKVIIPAHTFVAQANAVLWAGLEPVFVDSVREFTPDAAEASLMVRNDTLCYFPVHLLGTAGWNGYFPRNIPVIEDCCESMGGTTHDGKDFGTMGIAGAFSMYPSHTITTGEGGLIITDNDEFHEIARSIHNHGKIATDFDFKYVGINAKMTNLQAAIGCELIGTIDKVNEKRRENVSTYNELLGLDFKATAPHCYPIIYNNKQQRDSALETMDNHNIEARKLMGCIPELAYYSDNYGHGIARYPNASRFSNCGMFLPIHHRLSYCEIERICDVVKKTR